MTTPTTTPLPDRLARLDELKLDHGAHDTFEQGHCAMELVSWLADEPFSYRPDCASPVIASFLVSLNDRLSDERRQLLKPVLPLVIAENTFHPARYPHRRECITCQRMKRKGLI